MKGPNLTRTPSLSPSLNLTRDIIDTLNLNFRYSLLSQRAVLRVLHRKDVTNPSEWCISFMNVKPGNFVLVSTIPDGHFLRQMQCVYGVYNTLEEANATLAALEMLRNG